MRRQLGRLAVFPARPRSDPRVVRSAYLARYSTASTTSNGNASGASGISANGETRTSAANASPSRMVQPDITFTTKEALQNLPLPVDDDVKAGGDILAWVRHISQRFDRWALVAFKTEYQFVRSTVRCYLRCKILHSDVVIRAAGEGESKGEALDAARLFLVSELHSIGHLKGMCDRIRELEPFDISALLKDIFHYASHFNLVPQLTPPIKCEATDHVKVTITMPEQGIEVSGVATSGRFAAAAASIAFKREAERYCRENPEALRMLETPSLIASNATLFLAFYKNVHALAEGVEFRVPAADIKEDFGARAQVYLHGERLGPEVFHSNEHDAALLAVLSAAVTLRNRQPELWPAFMEELSTRGDLTLVPPQSVPFQLNESTLTKLRDTTRLLKDTMPTHDSKHTCTGQIPGDASNSQTAASEMSLSQREKELKDFRQKYWYDKRLVNVRKATRALPIYSHMGDIVRMVDNNEFCVILGPTGTGKSTQVPQIILNAAIARSEGASRNILVAQPYASTAKSLSQRVAFERGERLGPTVHHHSQWGPARLNRPGGIAFSPADNLLKRLQLDPDGVLERYSHVIIDEVDTRDINLDTLISYLKTMMVRRKQKNAANPTLILMGSTVDASHLRRYLGDLSSPGSLCPSVYIPSQTYPVKATFLEDLVGELSSSHEAALLQPWYQENQTSLFLSKEGPHPDYPAKADSQDTIVGGKNTSGAALNWDEIGTSLLPIARNNGPLLQSDNNIPLGLVVATIAHISKTKQDDDPILVFLPDPNDILVVQRMLVDALPLRVNFRDERRFRILQLYSAPDMNDPVFDPLPGGCRKIILSGSIAETSVTIPDIRYVIDAGRSYPFESDPESTCCWIDKASMQRRLETAAKAQGGAYYALFSSQRYDSLLPAITPASHQADIQDVCLAAKMLAPEKRVADFFTDSIDPPHRPHIENSVARLQKMGALNDQEDLTPLGKALSTLPFHPALSKFIVLGIIFRCLEPMMLLGQSDLGQRIYNIPSTPEGFKTLSQMRTQYSKGADSHHVSMINAFKSMRSNTGGADRNIEREKLLNYAGCEQLSRKLARIQFRISHMGLIAESQPNKAAVEKTANTNSNDMEMIRAVLVACLSPNIARRSPFPFFWRTAHNNALMSHTSGFKPRKEDLLAAYSSALDPWQHPATSAYENPGTVTLIENTFVKPLVACLLGGKLAGSDRTLMLEEWLPFDVSTGKSSFEDTQAANSVLEFRESFDTVLSMAFERFAELSRRNLSDPTGQRKPHDDPLFSDLSATLLKALRGTLGQEPDIPKAKFQLRRVRVE